MTEHSMPALNSKLADFGTTIFSVMSKLAADHGALNLSQGFPDFEGPQALRDRVSWHLNNGHNQYAPLPGVAHLREQIAAKVLDLYAAHVDPQSQVVVTPGATEALFCAITALVHPGDEVLILDPAYDTYDPCVQLNGGVPVHVPMGEGFSPDWAAIREAITPRSRVLMLNSPHNPSGSMWASADITALRALLDEHDLYLISDEVYEHIIFDQHQHQGLLRYPDLAARAFVVSSFGKTYHVTGWRVGYCIAPAALMGDFLRIHQFINFSTNTPMQYALADFLQDCPQHHRALGAFYQPKRDLFCELLDATRFSYVPAAGTYFQLADYSNISDLPDTEFARLLTIEHGVAAVPVSVFYQTPPDMRMVRFCFAKDDQTLRAAGARLKAV